MPPTQKTVILDDDPTGTQSASGAAVILDWHVDRLERVLEARDGVYVLTNTRAMTEQEAVALLTRIRDEADALAARADYDLQYVLRGDSTLRGHVFAESEVFMGAESILVFAPAFPAGGRVTVDGRHYVTVAGERVPAHLTEYAEDPVFPFTTSSLEEYVRAGSGRTAERLPSAASGSGAIADALAAMSAGGVALFDAARDDELRVLADGIGAARRAGADIVVRCASPLAAQLAGVESAGLLSDIRPRASDDLLVVCGSHTAGATEQLSAVRHRIGAPLEIDTDVALAHPAEEGERVASAALARIDSFGAAVIASARSRRPEHGTLEHGASVMAALTTAVARLADRVPVVVSKGGITSADVARVGLGARTAEVLGQILPGISLLRLENRHGNPMLYIVVPGNVGGPETLDEVLDLLDGRARGAARA